MDKYKGKLNSIYNTNIIQEYISNGSVYGYLGHENRTANMDIILENIFTRSGTIYKEIICEWVCSKIGRHFLDDCRDEEYFKDNIIGSIIEMQKTLLFEKV
jgi:hypothetical protein